MASSTSSTHGWRAFALAAAILVVVSGCGRDEQGNAQAGDVSVAFASPNGAAETFAGITREMEANAKTLGYELNVYDNEGSAPKSLEMARLIKNKSPDVAIDWVLDSTVTKSVGQIFTDADIPCIAMNTPIEGCRLFNISNTLYGEEAGQVLADEAVARGWKPDEVTVIGVTFTAGGENPAKATAYGYSSFTKNFPGMQVVEPDEITPKTTQLGDSFVQVDGEATIDGTFQNLRAALQSVPAERKLVVMTVNDESGTGAVKALDAAGRGENAILSSIGSSPIGLEGLRSNPMWVSEGAVYLDAWAGYTLAMAQAISEGAEVPDFTLAPQNTLTKETVDEFFDGATPKKAPPVPSESAYLLDTGVLQKLGLA